MAGKIIADQIEHSTAGSLDTSYVVNGSAKAWVNFNGTGTIAIRDSANVGSLTDNGTGDYTVNFSNSMGNVNYCLSLHATANTNFNNYQSYAVEQGTAATSSIRVGTNPERQNPREDVQFVHVSILGDLA